MKVPKRELSYGEILDKQRKLDRQRFRKGTKDFKAFEVKDSHPKSKHGAVITRKLSYNEKMARKDYGAMMQRLRNTLRDDV